LFEVPDEEEEEEEEEDDDDDGDCDDLKQLSFNLPVIKHFTEASC
jgi:hypothetical protein